MIEVCVLFLSPNSEIVDKCQTMLSPESSALADLLKGESFASAWGKLRSQGWQHINTFSPEGDRPVIVFERQERS